MFKIFLIPLIVILFSQITKLIIDAYKKQFSWQNLNAYGGMPSSHAAAVSSLCTIVALHDGLTETSFIIAFIFSILIIRDAIGVRQVVGRHAKAINKLVKELPDIKEDQYQYLEERIGHTIPQVSVGIIFGIIGAYLLNLIL